MAIFWILLFVGIIIAIVYYSINYGITPTPTSFKVMDELLNILPLNLKGEIVDLGSGWGTLVFALAKRYPSCHVVGIEISPIPYYCSLLLAKWYRYPNLTFIRKDLFLYPLHSTSLITCYLYPSAMQKLKIKFEQELLPGTYVLSHTFAIPGWKPIRCRQASDLYRTPIYLYEAIPVTVHGV